ncbi:MAG TPA: ABC transporter ATP-binding protein [Methylomirabilota bacterium]|jgi:branched-chain amino acid transport system ATP-binding protein|nr:ABC transporter ATP-binding protein [Methylomirabilota bacterium]
MLTLERVTGGYGDTTVLWEVSLEVRRGEAVALLGRNGMGKTTTLLAIMGLNPARAGRVAFKTTDITRKRPFEIARLGIGYAPEGRHLFAPLTVVQNLRIPFVNKHPDRASWPRQLERAFQLFPVLRERRGQAAGSLSGGEQQMLAIARALIGGDQLLVLDEPTEGLAPTVVGTIIDALRRLKAEGITVLLVEQNPATAFAVADRAYVLEKGRIALEGRADDLARDAALLQRYLGVDAEVAPLVAEGPRR